MDQVIYVLLLFKQISYHGSEEGGESEDSEGENQELAQIDRGVCVFVFIHFLNTVINCLISVGRTFLTLIILAKHCGCSLCKYNDSLNCVATKLTKN